MRLDFFHGLGDDFVELVGVDPEVGGLDDLVHMRDASALAQQEGARLAVVQAGADDFVVFVDARGLGEHPAGIRRDQIVEILHRAVAPQKRLIGSGGQVGGADDPRLVVDVAGP